MKFRALVLIPDDKPDINGEVFDRAGIELVEDVPVTFEFSRNYPLKCAMGRAKLSWGDDGFLYADIDLSPHVGPPALLAKLTPAIGGTVLDADAPPPNLWKAVKGGSPRVLRKTRLNEVGLSLGKNCDERIKTLGEQGCFPDRDYKMQEDVHEKVSFKVAAPRAPLLPDIDLDVPLEKKS